MRAIDMHVHVPRQEGLPEMGIEEGLRKFFRVRSAPEDAADLAARYREWDIFGVIFSVDGESSTGEPPDTNDYVAEIARAYPDQFIGFATVDPWKGMAAVEELERSVTELGLRGLKLHPHPPGLLPQRHTLLPPIQKVPGAGRAPAAPLGVRGRGRGPARRHGVQAEVRPGPSRASTTSQPTSPTSPSSWPTRRGPGSTSRSPWPCTSPTST